MLGRESGGMIVYDLEALRPAAKVFNVLLTVNPNDSILTAATHLGNAMMVCQAAWHSLCCILLNSRISMHNILPCPMLPFAALSNQSYIL